MSCDFEISSAELKLPDLCFTFWNCEPARFKDGRLISWDDDDYYIAKLSDFVGSKSGQPAASQKPK